MSASTFPKVRSFTKVFGNLFQFLQNSLSLATGVAFAMHSLLFGSWVAHIPHVKTSLGLNDAQLGVALFGMPIGLLMMNPFSPGVIARFGLARTTLGGLFIMAAAFALPLWMPERWTLLVALVIIGAVVAVVNVAVNTCATNIERAEGVYIMSTCHGMWSLGGMTGSGVAAALIGMGVAPRVHLSILAIVVMIIIVAWLRPVLKNIPESSNVAGESAGKKFTIPNRDLLLMIFIGLMVSMSEGVAFDWSAVYLRDILNAPGQIAALGFTCFSMAMMAMRFTGDVLIPRFGERNLLFFTALCSAFALIIIIVAPVPLIGILGFLLLGAGVALGAPILFNAAARVPGLAPGAGLATYATFSFMGFLAGPPIIGFIGEKFGLWVGFALVATLAVMSLAAIKRVRL